MDENSPVFENFLNKMRGSRPISESRTNISAEKLVGRPEPKTTKVSPSALLDVNEKITEMTRLVISIADTLKSQEKLELDILKEERKRRETNKRKSREDKLEKKKPILKGVFKSAIKPLKGFFDNIINFFRQLILGRASVILTDFFLKPGNIEKAIGLVNFISNNLPAIINTLLTLTAVIAGILTVASIQFIPGMLLAIGKMMLTNPIVAAAGVGLIANEAGLFGGENKFANIKAEGDVDMGDNNFNMNLNSGNNIQNNNNQNLNLNQNNNNQNFNQNNNFGNNLKNVLKFSGGAKVPGSGNRDTVPALLTPGEFVMSKGAVNKFGTGTMMAMNAMGGGTNIPKIAGGNSRTLMMNSGGDPRIIPNVNMSVIGQPITSQLEPELTVDPFDIEGRSSETPIKNTQQIASITLTGGSPQVMETLGITV